MANELIYKADARRAILKADPSLAYVIDEVKAVDAVEVVRCKDCKHWVTYFDCCEKKDITMHEDDFCSFGERREGE